MKRTSKKIRERPHLSDASIGELTQGTIFNCVRVPRYPDTMAVGVVITARCDIAQNKYPILNFVPAVPLSEWFKKDGLTLLIEAERKAILAKITQVLKDAQISPALLDSVDLAKIAEVHFPKDAANKAAKKLAERFEKAASEMSTFASLLESDDSDKIFDWFAKNKVKDVKGIITRLSKHEVSGYYFLEHLHKDEDQPSFVCLLRDVSAISRDLSEKIAKGLSSAGLEGHFNNSETGLFNISNDDLSMPISCIGSPTIEHLMQTFSSLFGRIGLEDPDADFLDSIVTNLSEKNEG
ncbi:hypothetical protein [Pacificibacter sp. AS14]|uniref:hypothetical protein n=1 Tax=Pacificibacter sp. AS14 TaxID=3135785 RepID=UPI003181CCC0